MNIFPKCQKCNAQGWCSCSLTNIVQEDFRQKIKELVKNTPNDQELGAEMRKLINS